MQQAQNFSTLLHREVDWYVPWCSEMDIANQGKTAEEAVANVKEAVEPYLEDEDIAVSQATSFLTTFESTHDKISNIIIA